jgi:hypothetical protein
MMFSPEALIRTYIAELLTAAPWHVYNDKFAGGQPPAGSIQSPCRHDAQKMSTDAPGVR